MSRGRLALVLATVLLLSACTSSKQYAGSKSDGAFFAVPNGWTRIENKDLNNSLNEKGKGSSSTTNVVQTQSNSNNDKLNDTTENDKNAHDRKKGK